MSGLTRARDTVWGELVKVQIPIEAPETCHLYFSFRNRSVVPSSSSTRTAEQPFAFAYLPLFARNDLFQTDGSHTLVLYRWDLSVSVPGFYLQGPATRQIDRAINPLPPAVMHTLVPLPDTFVARTLLVSTDHTQNETLVKLLRWRTELLQSPETTRNVLAQLA